MGSPQVVSNTREPIQCEVTGKLLARVDWERKKLYLWCKSEQCKGWHEYDLEALERMHNGAAHIA